MSVRGDTRCGRSVCRRVVGIRLNLVISSHSWSNNVTEKLSVLDKSSDLDRIDDDTDMDPSLREHEDTVATRYATPSAPTQCSVDAL